MARHIGHHLRLVVDLVPHHSVSLACGAGGSHGEDEAPRPRHLEQLQYLSALVVVWEEAEAREASTTVRLTWVGMLRTLSSRGDAVYDLDGATVWVAGQGLGEAVNLHLALGLSPCLLPVDCLARRALEAAILGSVVVHSQHAEHVEGVSALGKLPHGAGRYRQVSALRGSVVAGGTGQAVHTDDAVLETASVDQREGHSHETVSAVKSSHFWLIAHLKQQRLTQLKECARQY